MNDRDRFEQWWSDKCPKFDSINSGHVMAAWMEATRLYAPKLPKYRHKKTGNIYQLITIANGDATRPGWASMAVYRDSEGKTWCRPLDEWLYKYEPIREKE